jgi:tRNA G18 (ribose-2'-O)-methylase SpoU
MQFIEVSDLNHPDVQIYQRLRENAFGKDGSFIADSPNVVKLIMEAGIKIKSIFATPEYFEKNRALLEAHDIPIGFVAEKPVLEQVVGHRLHHNVMMHALRPEETALEDLGSEIIMLTEISNADNIGAIARSAAALGVKGYLVPKQGPHPYSRRAVRVSMGHIGKLDYHCYGDIKETITTLKALGYRIFAAEVTADSTPLSQVKIPGKWVLLMGHEQLGISDEILSLCDEVVTIEMEEGIKSFNVAIAASIMMYQFKRGSSIT